MTKFAVVYYSATGTTEILARAVAAGIHTNVGAEAALLKIEGEDVREGRYENPELLQQLDSCHGIVFGSPTFMGSVAAQFKAFMDATSERWGRRAWTGKLAAGFTIGGSPSGDQLNTLQTLQVFASQHGMLWSGIDLPAGWDSSGRNRLGSQSGLTAVRCDSNGVHQLDRLTAMYLGERIAGLRRSILTEGDL
ncbi:flavodoxin family protein [Microbulbifer marinus]|uniref:Multimeric flavodoxin WrbA n=1 Tax=Microbulbifer marinus TaxID=658218 RepID=A0A1H3W4T9_9GAMM|nr:flavodoxin family protein [Microbulbifer marinus]SDZ82097.1 Multimeric flavodoxin WrbA [Microbulbifer marinus]